MLQIQSTQRTGRTVRTLEETRPCRVVVAEQASISGPCRCGETRMVGTQYSPPTWTDPLYGGGVWDSLSRHYADTEKTEKTEQTERTDGRRPLVAVVGYTQGRAAGARVALVETADSAWCVCPRCSRTANATLLAVQVCRTEAETEAETSAEERGG